MNENKQKNSRRRLNSLILLVAFTAIMLIVSTYAWFSTQKNVSLSGLEGTVKVAEGLQISLDAKTWSNGIDFTNYASDTFKNTYVPGATLENPYKYPNTDTATKTETPLLTAVNVLPDELLPVSTTGAGDDISGANKSLMAMYEGKNVNGNQLYNIEKKTEEKASGYYAIDLFLQNSSKESVLFDPLLLQSGSVLTVKSTDKSSTGLQNTARVALVQYKNSGDDKVKVDKTPSVENIIAGTTNTEIDSVAIWEPNANAHVQYIVDSNNNITWKKADVSEGTPLENDEIFKAVTWASDGEKKIKFGLTSQVPTYALSSTALTVKDLTKADTKIADFDDEKGSLTDIYNWGTGTTAKGLVKQNTLQTTTAGVGETNVKLISTQENNQNNTNFEIPGGQYVRLRMYIWLEGQDVDCTNYASLGGAIKIDFGFSKEGSQP